MKGSVSLLRLSAWFGPLFTLLAARSHASQAVSQVVPNQAIRPGRVPARFVVVFGDCWVAEGSEILASRDTAADSRFPVSSLREVTPKGISEPIQVVTVDWQ
jgi:hypothetical protein